MRYILITLVCLPLLAWASLAERLHSFVNDRERSLLQDYGVVKPAQQTVHLNFPSNTQPWKTVDQVNSQSGFFMIFVPSNESLKNWNESIKSTIIPYGNYAGISAKKVFQVETEDARRYCQRVEAKIIAQTAQSITYSLIVWGCPGDENQLQVGKAFNGLDAVYAVRYSAMMGKVTKSEYDVVAHVIQSSRLIQNPN